MLSTLYGEKVDIQSYLKKYIAHEIYMEPYFNIKDFTKNYFINNKATCFDGELNEIYDKTTNGGEKLAILWQSIYLKSTLSLRKYQQGFISINYLYSKITQQDDKTLIIYALIVYMKSTYPVEYQLLHDSHYWNEKFESNYNNDKGVIVTEFSQNINRIYGELIDNLSEVSSEFPLSIERFIENNKDLFKDCRRVIEYHTHDFLPKVISNA